MKKLNIRDIKKALANTFGDYNVVNNDYDYIINLGEEEFASVILTKDKTSFDTIYFEDDTIFFDLFKSLSKHATEKTAFIVVNQYSERCSFNDTLKKALMYFDVLNKENREMQDKENKATLKTKKDFKDAYDNRFQDVIITDKIKMISKEDLKIVQAKEEQQRKNKLAVDTMKMEVEKLGLIITKNISKRENKGGVKKAFYKLSKDTKQGMTNYGYAVVTNKDGIKFCEIIQEQEAQQDGITTKKTTYNSAERAAQVATQTTGKEFTAEQVEGMTFLEFLDIAEGGEPKPTTPTPQDGDTTKKSFKITSNSRDELDLKLKGLKAWFYTNIQKPETKRKKEEYKSGVDKILNTLKETDYIFKSPCKHFKNEDEARQHMEKFYNEPKQIENRRARMKHAAESTYNTRKKLEACNV